ncbi:tyrosine-type recombinase/integrase [Nanoarchaeota archaeon]
MEQKQRSLRIYPHREKTFELELKRLQKSEISLENKELITRFQNYLFSKGDTGSLRVAKLSSQLRRMCSKLSKSLGELYKEDLINLVALYNQDPSLSDSTKTDYRRCLKQFYLWFKEEDKRFEHNDVEAKKLYKFVEKELKTSFTIKQADPSTIITEEDCSLVIEKGCRTTRERAFVSMLHELGARAGEFLNIKLGDIEVKDSYGVVQLDGKTGLRKVFITKSLPHLIRHLELHPYKDNKNSYLWLSEANCNRDDPLLHKGAQKLVDRCFNRAKVEKRHNLHWFRHSRATILAPKLTTPLLCKYMGWSLNSDQIKTYCHLSVKQLEDTFLALNGIKPKEEEQEKLIKCICGTLNNPSERYCYKCCKPLRVETVIQDQELIKGETNKTIEFLMQIAESPQLLEKFKKFKEQLK